MIHEPLRKVYNEMNEDVKSLTPEEQTNEYNKFIEIMQKSPNTEERNTLSLILSLIRKNHIIEEETFCDFPYVKRMKDILYRNIKSDDTIQGQLEELLETNKIFDAQTNPEKYIEPQYESASKRSSLFVFKNQIVFKDNILRHIDITNIIEEFKTLDALEKTIRQKNKTLLKSHIKHFKPK